MTSKKEKVLKELDDWFDDLESKPQSSIYEQMKNESLDEKILRDFHGFAPTIDEKYKVSLVKDLFLDAGFSNKKEVLENGINIGSPTTYLPSFNDIGSNCVTGTAIDDRAGCAVILNIAKIS